MFMDSVFDKLTQGRVLPVLTIDDAADAVPLARAICAGGLHFAEVTFRTAAAEESIRRIRAELPTVVVGAGTILREEQAVAAVCAGAQFLVSPGLNPAIVRRAAELGVPIIPGCVTPTEMEAAMSLGLTAVKFFPAQQAGGIAYIKACAAPYSGLRFVPTGGISAENLAAYLALDCVLACGGSWMAPPKLIAAQDWEGITRMCREACAVRDSHV
jgi:2-dehydro-3-deoxyphosphogluconate aldolase/(4S)-4-hydroxy-2-oxoglutarate aldolase